MNWKEEFTDYWNRQDEKKEPVYLFEVEYKVRNLLARLIDDIPESCLHDHENNKTRKQQLKDKYLNN